MELKILGTRYETTDANSMKTLKDHIDATNGANSLRMFAYVLLDALLITEIPKRYYKIMLTDPDGESIDFPIEYQPTKSYVTDEEVVDYAISHDYIAKIFREDITGVHEITKDIYHLIT